jgi:Xaa-Pro dipeptidase
MERLNLNEVFMKEERSLRYMEENGYDAVVIGRRDNFAWLTCGGDNSVVRSAAEGVCLVIITKEDKLIVANTMDGQRIIDEEMREMGYSLKSLYWYEDSPAQWVSGMLRGRKAVSDVSLQGVDFKPGALSGLHYPLSEAEVQRYRTLGREAEEVICKVLQELQPGMLETEVKQLFQAEYATRGMDGIVYIIGSDERIGKYRHCIASGKSIAKLVMMAPACQKWGLVMPITRMVYFGDKLPEELERKYEALCRIEASTFAACVPYAKFPSILEVQKRMYLETGFGEEWRNHFQGGITGYIVNDPTKCLDSNAAIVSNQTFNWYLTLDGAKVEETLLVTENGQEIISSNGLWPVKEYSAGGRIYNLPQIAMK